MSRVVVVIASGPEHEQRAHEGLSLARAMHEIGMLDDVRVLLTGPGVRCLDPDAADADRLRDAVEGLLQAGVPVAACTRSLHEHHLLDAVADLEAVRPVGGPTFLSEQVIAGARLLTF
jgi:hypothetical protein